MKKIDPRTSALLVIDTRNDVVRPKRGWVLLGADLGYEIALVSDATCTMNDEWQAVGAGYTPTMLGEVVTTADVLKAL